MAPPRDHRDTDVARPPRRDPPCEYPVPALCDPVELEPLAEHLRSNAPVAEARRFPRGTVTADGRLDLCKQAIGPEGLRRVAGALAHNSEVHALLLGADQLGAAGSAVVADILRQNFALRTVYLGCNAIGREGALAVTRAVADHGGVRALWLKRNAIGPDGARHVAAMLPRAPALRTLDLVCNDLGNEGLEFVVRALVGQNTGLRALYVGGNRVDAEGGILLGELLRANTGLRALYAGTNPLGDPGARAVAAGLAHNRGLRVLALPSADIGPEGVRALCDAARAVPSLRRFELGFARDTFALAQRPNRLGDAGALHVAALLGVAPALRAVDLSGNGITDAGAAPLIEALEAHEGLTGLTVGRLGAAVQAKLNALLERNRARVAGAGGDGDRDGDDDAGERDVADIKSVYRTARRRRAGAADNATAAEPAREE